MAETNPVKRLFNADRTRKKGLRAAVDAMCSHCVGCTATEQGDGIPDHMEEGFRITVKKCSAVGCPLHHVRPFQ